MQTWTDSSVRYDFCETPWLVIYFESFYVRYNVCAGQHTHQLSACLEAMLRSHRDVHDVLKVHAGTCSACCCSWTGKA